MTIRRIKHSHESSYDEAVAAALDAFAVGNAIIAPDVCGYLLIAPIDTAAKLTTPQSKNPTSWTIYPSRAAFGSANSDAPTRMRRLTRALLPGPVILRNESRGDDTTEVPETGGTVSSHPLIQRIATATNEPRAAVEFAPAGATIGDPDAALLGWNVNVELFIDAGLPQFSQPPTIVAVANESWRVVREGIVSERYIAKKADALVLFVCTGNSCRSPLAEYLFRAALQKQLGPDKKLADAGYEVASAGTAAFPGGPISDGSRNALAERSIDASGHQSQPVTVDLLQRAARIYTMTNSHRQAVLRIDPDVANRVALLDPNGDIADPIGGDSEVYERCAQQIAAAVARRVEEFVHEDRTWE